MALVRQLERLGDEAFAATFSNKMGVFLIWDRNGLGEKPPFIRAKII